ncbi:MAG: hypothetical protein ABW096_12410 [Candidatus Thiodiazotropha sp.]
MDQIEGEEWLRIRPWGSARDSDHHERPLPHEGNSPGAWHPPRRLMMR